MGKACRKYIPARFVVRPRAFTPRRRRRRRHPDVSSPPRDSSPRPGGFAPLWTSVLSLVRGVLRFGAARIDVCSHV
uniref:Predicted protein n=1 Tax=Hordeum vulgare subsp. vulgare TaxID=112509 RepID=F2DBR7_HORVV|nr:predicted protein [Hordeum vulgare subsp. vulgare]